MTVPDARPALRPSPAIPPERAGQAAAAEPPSLRSRLQRRVLLPLALTWLVGSALTSGVAYVFTQTAFDRSLLDDAYALAANITETRDSEVALNLSAREIGTVLFDQSERVFFAVRRADGLLVAGHAGLPMSAADPDRLWQFADRYFNGASVRVVTLHREPPQDFVVAVAQTVQSRTELLKRLLALSIFPQALLLLALAIWLNRTIGDELRPLVRLQNELQTRTPSDLSPIDVPATSRDISRLSAAASSLLARIADGVRSQREFAGNVAHELRTPLAGIRSLAEYGLARPDPAIWRTQLQAILASQERASHLVDQLLDLARAEESREGLELTRLALDERVHEVLLRLMPRADARHADLGAEGLDEPVWVTGHAALIEGLLVNLVDNALRHGRPTQAEVVPRITVSLARDPDGRVRLAVADNGPGLPMLAAAGDAAPTPERWSRGPSSAADGHGTGLGLAICSRYAELLGSRLCLARGPGGVGLVASVHLAPAEPA